MIKSMAVERISARLYDFRILTEFTDLQLSKKVGIVISVVARTDPLLQGQATSSPHGDADLHSGLRIIIKRQCFSHHTAHSDDYTPHERQWHYSPVHDNTDGPRVDDVAVSRLPFCLHDDFRGQVLRSAYQGGQHGLSVY